MEQPIGSVSWPEGAKAAVSLTYDGGLADHLLLAEPMLRILGIRGTFYLNASRFLDHITAWQSMASEGHEIGNHSMYGVTGPGGEVLNWSLQTVSHDLEMTEELLRGYVPGALDRSFAYPGPRPQCAEGSYELAVERHFRWARTWHEGFNHVLFANPKALLSMPTAGFSGPRLIQQVDEALDLGAWVIFVFEGLGSGSRACSDRDHDALLRHLAARRKDLLIAPVRELAEFITIIREQMTVR